jgi:methionine-rich copper-binding protein CopC
VIRHAAVVVLVGLTLLVGAGPAQAHSFLVSSNPADGSALATGPSSISLTFNNPVQKGFDTLTVVGPDGNLWSTGDTHVDGTNASVDVLPLGPAGTYTIGFRVISADSHPVTGSKSFTLITAGTGTPGPPADKATASTASSSSGGAGGVPAWVFVLGAAVVFGGGLVLALRSGRRAAPRTPGHGG